MSWLGLARALVSLALAIAEHVRNRGLVEAGRSAEIAASLKGAPMTGLTRSLPRVAMLALATPVLAGCATRTATDGRTDVACTAFEPLRWSRRDTDESVRQAKEHNAAWEALCRRPA